MAGVEPPRPARWKLRFRRARFPKAFEMELTRSQPHIGPILQPIAHDDEVAARSVSQMSGCVDVTDHDGVLTLGEPRAHQVAGHPSEQDIMTQGVLPARLGDSVRQGNPQIGMDRTIESNGEPMAKHCLHDPIPGVPGPNAVAVGEKNTAPLVGYGDRSLMDVETDVPFEVGTAPEVVVAAEIGDRGAGLDQLGECAQHAEMALGDGVAVFEPEVEQIAEYIEMGGSSAEMPEPRDQRSLPHLLIGAATQMGVAQEVDRFGLILHAADCIRVPERGTNRSSHEEEGNGGDA